MANFSFMYDETGEVPMKAFTLDFHAPQPK